MVEITRQFLADQVETLKEGLTLEMILFFVNSLIILILIILAIRFVYMRLRTKTATKKSLPMPKKPMIIKEDQGGKKEFSKPIKVPSDDDVVEDLTKFSIEPWGRKKKNLNTAKHLSYVEQELADIYEGESENQKDAMLKSQKSWFNGRAIFEDEFSVLKEQVEDYKKKYPKIKRWARKENEYKLKLAQVDSQLGDSDYPASLQKRFKLLKSYDLRKLPSYEHIEIQKELDHVKDLLAKADSDPETFIGRVKRKVKPPKPKSEIEKLAIELVRKISAKIEKEHPIPPMEIDRVTEEIEQLKKDLYSNKIQTD